MFFWYRVYFACYLLLFRQSFEPTSCIFAASFPYIPIISLVFTISRLLMKQDLLIFSEFSDMTGVRKLEAVIGYSEILEQ